MIQEKSIVFCLSDFKLIITPVSFTAQSLDTELTIVPSASLSISRSFSREKHVENSFSELLFIPSLSFSSCSRIPFLFSSTSWTSYSLLGVETVSISVLKDTLFGAIDLLIGANFILLFLPKAWWSIIWFATGSKLIRFFFLFSSCCAYLALNRWG